MNVYIYERLDWPHFYWDQEHIGKQLAPIRYKQGILLGRMEALGFDLKQEAVLQTLTQDVLKTSEIEGENLDAEQVRSSLARRLGIDIGGLEPVDRNVDGIVEMLLDATAHFEDPLTMERLFAWHASLFPSARSGMARISVGTWRDDRKGPIQVVSGPLGRERIHFQAPSVDRLGYEMTAFLRWFNASATPMTDPMTALITDPTISIDPVLRAALGHLWFVTIHPFDDGNGRIARAISDLALARSEGSSHRFYSMSAHIRQERNAYYNILERTQKGPMDITPWMEWFLSCLERAIDGAQTELSSVLFKAQFWKKIETVTLNGRQRLLLNRLLDGFDGKLTSSKWAKIAKCSQDTALRDIDDLMGKDVLIKDLAGGRSTNYMLCSTRQS